VEELGGDGAMVDHVAKLERDRFDPHFDHLLLIDENRSSSSEDNVVGVYRLLPSDRVEAAGQYYSEDEYDLTPLRQSGRRLLELGRSCVDAGYRGGTAMYRLWQGLAEYVVEREIDVLFGVASFHGTDPWAIAAPLSHLHAHYLAPPDLRVSARTYQRMDLLDPDKVDRVAAMRNTPALIKAYLRLGGFVGDGAFIDHAFNTIDVCLVMDTKNISESARASLTRARA
jgi:putative hemolysin